MEHADWAVRAGAAPFDVRDVVDGVVRAADCGETIEKRTGRDGAVVATYGSGDAAATERAVAAAARAFEDGRWASLSVHRRKAVLRSLADLVVAHTEELALLESLDTGKPIPKAEADVAVTAAVLRAAAEGADKVFGPSALDGGRFTYQLRKPVGVVGAIVGWNYPLMLAGQKIGPALAMGNSLVLKPSEFTSLATWRLAELALEAGVPDGVFNVVNGTGAIVGGVLARSPSVRLLSFTGSSATGRRLMEAAGQSNMKRLILECGGKSPVLVFDDVEGDLDRLAANIIVDTAFRNQGALCVAGSRILLQQGIAKRLLPKLVEQAKALAPADPLDPATRFGAIMSEAHLEKVLGYVADGERSGARRLCGGERALADTGGAYMTPCLFDDVALSTRIAQEEIFGPVACITTFATEEEGVRLANATEYGLAAYAFTQDAGRMQRLGRGLEAGAVVLIASLDGAPGGVAFGTEPQKQSGFGIDSGLDGLRAYTVQSNVNVMF